MPTSAQIKEAMALGFTPEDFGVSGLDAVDEPVTLWPENVQSWNVFTRMGTQWRVSMAGAYGLDYGALYPYLAQLRLDDDRWHGVFDDIQHCEREALAAMAEKSAEGKK